MWVASVHQASFFKFEWYFLKRCFRGVCSQDSLTKVKCVYWKVSICLKCVFTSKERYKFSQKTDIYIFFDSEWEYDCGESDLELTSHPLCGHPKGIRFLFFYKWLCFNFKYTKVSRCCFIEQHFIIFRKFASSKSFWSCQNTKEAEEGIDEARYYTVCHIKSSNLFKLT